MQEYSYLKRALLRKLSEDSRKSVTTLAKELGCSRNTIIANMKFLEKEFDIKYTIQFKKQTVGFVQKHVLAIKFGVKPNLNKIKEIFENDQTVQFVAVTQGEFDLLIDVVVGTGEQYWQWGMNAITKLLPYKPTITASLVVMSYFGFIPIPDATLKNLDLSKLGMDEIDMRILILLNNNSRLSYRAIAKSLKLDHEIVRYKIRKLSNMDIIQRFTLIMQKPPTDFNIAFFFNYKLSEDIGKRSLESMNYYNEIDGKTPLINSFQYLAVTTGAYLFFGIGCFKDKEEMLEKSVLYYKHLYEKDELVLAYALITKVIKGSLAIRNLDMTKEFNRPRHISYLD